MENNNIVIRHARIIDLNGHLDLVGDVLITGGEMVAALRIDFDVIPVDSLFIVFTCLVASPGFNALNRYL